MTTKHNVKIINNTTFETKDIEEITLALLSGQLAPNFYLICVDNCFKGVTLTNLDKPTMIIYIDNLGKFAEIFVHELVHLQQHQKDYVNESEAEERELIVSNKYNKLGVKH